MSERIVDAMEAWERALRGDKRQPRGVRKYIWTLHQVVQFYGTNAEHTDLTHRSVQDLKEDMADRELAGATIGNTLSVIRCFCRWAIDAGLRSDDPTLRIRWPKKAEPLPRALSGHERELLLGALAAPLHQDADTVWYWQRNRRAILLMLYTGLRLAEAAALLWRDVDLDAPRLTVRSGKGGKDRVVPLHPQLVAELRRVPAIERFGKKAVIGQRADGAQLTYKSFANLFCVWLPRQLGAVELVISAHQLRHTFATQLLAHGADLKAIQELLGHKRLDTTERYLALDDRHKRAAVERLPAYG